MERNPYEAWKFGEYLLMRNKKRAEERIKPCNVDYSKIFPTFACLLNRKIARK